jgi:Ca2+-binding RTX toxin-like protein
LSGGTGDNVLNGGSGTDTADYAGTAQDLEGYTVELDLEDGLAFHTGGVDTLIKIENAYGSVFADQLVGNALANRLEGSSGDDLLVGRAGDDTLFGGSGNDALVGNAGADRLHGGDGIDQLYYGESAAGIVLDLASGTASGGDAEGDVFSGIENVFGTPYDDALYGNDLANALSGYDGNDTLLGRGGDDTLGGWFGNDLLDGGAGADTMSGDKGNDTYVVDNPGDTLFESASGGTDLVKSSIGFLLPANVERLALTGSGNINGTGNALDNRIAGNSGNNALNGGSGADSLRGRGGNDTLTGGGGADDFVFGDGDGFDIVTDFQNGSDRFDLKAVAAVATFADLAVIDNGPTVTVDYGTGSFAIANVDNPLLIDASDFVF